MVPKGKGRVEKGTATEQNTVAAQAKTSPRKGPGQAGSDVFKFQAEAGLGRPATEVTSVFNLPASNARPSAWGSTRNA